MVSTGGNNYSTVDEEVCCEHAKPSIRTCKIERNSPNSPCGFHLTRTKWDPYPWIAGVEKDTPADLGGLKVGDCVLEVNGEDIIGLKVSDIAKKVLTDRDVITLLLWNAGNDSSCDQESICCAPMPTSLSRLSNCLNLILSSLECPVCFEVIPPPTHQCPLGHVICFKCHAYTEKCPICRTRYNKDRNIVADKVYDSLIDAFQLRSQPIEVHSRKLWDRLFNRKKREEQLQKIDNNNSNHPTNSHKTHFKPFDIKNKFLSKLTIGKSTSVDNLGPSSNLSKSNDYYHRHPYNRKKSLSTNELFRPSRNSNNSSLNASNLSLYNNNNQQQKSKERYNDDVCLLVISSDRSTNLFRCPCDEYCTQRSTIDDIIRHIQYAHDDGPILHYRRNEFRLNFPLSFPDELTVIVLSCYEKTFFVKILPNYRPEKNQNNEPNNRDVVKVHVWSLTDPERSSGYKVIGTMFKSNPGCNLDHTTELTFKTFVHSLLDEPTSSVIYKDQIVITKSLIDAYFPDNVFSLSVTIISTG